MIHKHEKNHLFLQFLNHLLFFGVKNKHIAQIDLHIKLYQWSRSGLRMIHENEKKSPVFTVLKTIKRAWSRLVLDFFFHFKF